MFNKCWEMLFWFIQFLGSKSTTLPLKALLCSPLRARITFKAISSRKTSRSSHWKSCAKKGTHVLNKESKRDRDSEIVIPENYKKTAWISYSLILPSFTSWKLLFCCPHFNLQSWCCTCDDSTWTLKSWPQQKVIEIFHHEKSVNHLIFHLKDFQGIFFGGGDSLNHPPRNLIIPAASCITWSLWRNRHLCHQDTNWIPLVGQGGSSKFKPRWFCDSFLDSKNPKKKKGAKTWAKQHKSGAVWIFGCYVSFCLKTKKSTRQLFNFSLSKRWSNKNPPSPTLDTVAATVAGQDKANAGHHLDTTPPSPTQDASSSPPGLYHHIFRRPGIPYKPLCVPLLLGGS